MVFIRNCWLVFLVIFYSSLFFGCEKRPRNNPLDPENTETGGKPVGVRIYSKQDTIFLTWQKYDLTALKAYRIYRTIAGNAENKLSAEIGEEFNYYEDRGVAFNKTYCYQISAVTPDFESELSDPVCITPGPTYTWVIEGSPGSVTRLTHDCSNILVSRQITGYPGQIVINSADRTVWVFDDFLNRIYHFDANCNFLNVNYDYNNILDMDVSEPDHSLWLVRYFERELIKLDANGVVLHTIGNFLFPRSLAVDQTTGICWIGDLHSDAITGYSKNGRFSKKITYDFQALKSLAIYHASHDLWIADSTRILKSNVRKSGEIVQINNENFLDLNRITVDQQTGCCWACDLKAIYKFKATGELEFRTEGFYSVISLAVNSYDGSCLIVEGYRARLVRISADGKTMEEIGNIEYPAAVAVEY